MSELRHVNTRRYAEIVRRKVTEARAAQVCSARLARLAPQALLARLPPIFFVHIGKSRCVFGLAWRGARRYVVRLENCTAQTSWLALRSLFHKCRVDIGGHYLFGRGLYNF